jgi:hypothetical protein
MFLDLQTLLFYTTCVAGFFFGLRISRLFCGSVRTKANLRVSARNPLAYLLAPLLTATLLCSISLMLLGGRLNFVTLLAAQQGDAIKVAGQTGQLYQGRWSKCIPLLTAVLWWSLFRATQLQVKKVTKTIFYLSLFVGMGVGILTCIATVDRGNLMPIILGLLIVYLFRKTREPNVNIIKLATIGTASGTGIIGTFLFLSFLRGALALRLLITSLLGYTIVSYNRMAALLGGVMHYAYESRGVYLSRYLLQDNGMSSVLHLVDRFGWPTPFVLWQTEVSSTLAAGLNPGYIWSGAFGYLYSDLAGCGHDSLPVTRLVSCFIHG